jgi:hypothetical protein
MGPGVTGDLVARVVGLLDGSGTVVDAAVELSGPEKGGLGTSIVEDIDELASVLSRAVVVGKCKDTGSAALADDYTSSLAIEELNGVFDGSSRNAPGEQKGANGSLKEGLHFERDMYSEGLISPSEMLMIAKRSLRVHDWAYIGIKYSVWKQIVITIA